MKPPATILEFEFEITNAKTTKLWPAWARRLHRPYTTRQCDKASIKSQSLFHNTRKKWCFRRIFGDPLHCSDEFVIHTWYTTGLITVMVQIPISVTVTVKLLQYRYLSQKSSRDISVMTFVESSLYLLCTLFVTFVLTLIFVINHIA